MHAHTNTRTCTGDKIGTAISIANSCRLFSPGMPLVILKEQDFEDAVNQAAGGEACPLALDVA
eukprot:scaffold176823_cov22-Tisochrysis_lutea.AAC.1